MTSGELTPEREAQIRQSLDTIPFAKLLGIEVDALATGVATLSFLIKEELKRNHGIVHGGAITSLVDSAMAFASLSLIESGQRTTTVDLTINFLRPLRSGKATATARVIKAGRRIIVLSAEVFDETGKLVATALSSYIKD